MDLRGRSGEGEIRKGRPLVVGGDRGVQEGGETKGRGGGKDS